MAEENKSTDTYRPDIHPNRPAYPYDIAALIFGIVSAAFSMIPFLGILLSAVGFIMGMISNQRCDDVFMEHSHYAKAGIVCSIIGAAISVVFSIVGTIMVMVFAKSLFDLVWEAISSMTSNSQNQSSFIFMNFSNILYMFKIM